MVTACAICINNVLNSYFLRRTFGLFLVITPITSCPYGYSIYCLYQQGNRHNLFDSYFVLCVLLHKVDSMLEVFPGEIGMRERGVVTLSTPSLIYASLAANYRSVLCAFLSTTLP